MVVSNGLSAKFMAQNGGANQRRTKSRYRGESMGAVSHRIGSAAVLAVMLSLSPEDAAAQRITCGDYYAVQAGDTLREIAVGAYGSGNFELIFDANRDVLSTPSLLLVGQRLFIPCLDGSGPATREERSARQVQDGLEAPTLSASTLALPAPIPQPSEEELFGEETEAAEPTPGTPANEAQVAALSQGAIQRNRRPRLAAGTAEFVPQTDEQRLLKASNQSRQLFQPGVSAASRSARLGGGAVAGVQPPAAQGATGSAGAIAGIQPGARAVGTRAGGIAGVQPGVPAGRAVTTQPAAAQTATQPAAGRGSGAGGIAGIQPGATTRRAARAPVTDPAAVLLGAAPAAAEAGAASQPVETAAVVNPPLSGATSGGTAQTGSALVNPPARAATGEAAGQSANAAAVIARLQTGGGAGNTGRASVPERDPGADAARVLTGPLALRPNPEDAPPRPQQQPAPDQLVPRLALSLDQGLNSPRGRILPDVPAQELGTQSGSDAAASLNSRGDAGQAPIRLLSGPYAPFAGSDLPDRGMLSDVVLRAIDRAEPGRAVRVSFINDWSAHLSILLPDGAFDIGYPWLRPDCNNPRRLAADLRSRCADFIWSQPLHEMVIGYFVLSGGAYETARDHEELAGARICRPAGEPVFDLAQNGLIEPTITFVSARTVEQCLELLSADQADVVSLGVSAGEAAIDRLGLAGQVAELPDLADIMTLHALSPRSNPAGRAYITLINRGLRTMRESGEWYEVVARHLAGIAN